MSTSPTSDPIPSRGGRSFHSKLALLVLFWVGVPLAAGTLFVACLVGWFVIQWDEGNIDADIPPDRARVELAERLRRFVNVTLDPSARVVAAHEYRNGFRGGGDSWYLVRLDPVAAARFEANFLATVRTQSGSGHIVPYADRLGTFRALSGLSPKSELPPGARAWWLGDPRNTCAVFFDDKFYFYLDDF